MNDLVVRSLAAIVLIAVTIAAVFHGGYYFAILVAAGATAVFYEWTRVTRGWGASWYVGGFLYTLIAALALLWIRDRADNGVALVMWVFLIVWATDVGAYFAGRAIGGPKLAPVISPKKTWAGFYGGVAAATVLGTSWVYLTGLGTTYLLLAPLFSAAAQGGDLFESWMKRRAGVKDSGSMLPGHGGVFDRLDGLLPVAVLTACSALASVA